MDGKMRHLIKIGRRKLPINFVRCCWFHFLAGITNPSLIHYSTVLPYYTMRTVWQVTLPVLVVAASFAEGSTGTDVSSTGVSCDLQCANGGYCTLVEGTFEELAHDAQSGHLIEQCVCRPGFTGVACDTVVEECSLPERTCHNGAPCTQNSSGEWGCDCSIADSLSLFAGYQCRNPTTEYCSGKYDPNAALSFCTHGGRCIGDFLAAEVAPGDTAFNKAYQ